MTTATTEALHFIDQKHFWRDMMGISRSWYYKHLKKLDHPGFPTPVDVRGKKKLIKEECVAYQAGFVAEREKGGA